MILRPKKRVAKARADPGASRAFISSGSRSVNFIETWGGSIGSGSTLMRRKLIHVRNHEAKTRVMNFGLELILVQNAPL